jgi:hypothetical protein
MPSEKRSTGTKIVECTLLLNSELSSTSIGLHLLMEAGCDGIDCNRRDACGDLHNDTVRHLYSLLGPRTCLKLEPTLGSVRAVNINWQWRPA